MTPRQNPIPDRETAAPATVAPGDELAPGRDDGPTVAPAGGWASGFGAAPAPRLAGYEVQRVLGRGGMATVFAALQRDLGRVVAIKVLETGEGPLRPDIQRRFRREGRTLAALDHPNIVGVYDALADDTGMYLVLEFVDGPTLEELLPWLTIPMVLGCLRQLAGAIDYAGDRGIVHRDIKPSNVLVTAAGVCKLTDFGIAKVIEASLGVAASGGLTRLGDLLGTAAYISPEAASGSLEVGRPADVYSFGVLAYELLVGQLPFEGMTVSELLSAHASSPPARPSEVRPGFPPGVEAALLAALEKQPTDRPRSAAGFWEMLGREAAGAWPDWETKASLESAVANWRAPLTTAPQPPLGAAATTVASRPVESAIDPAVDRRSAGDAVGGTVDRSRPSGGEVRAVARFRPRRRRGVRLATAASICAVAVIVAVGATALLRHRRVGQASVPLAVVGVNLVVGPATEGHCPEALFDFRATIKTNGVRAVFVSRGCAPTE